MFVAVRPNLEIILHALIVFPYNMSIRYILRVLFDLEITVKTPHTSTVDARLTKHDILSGIIFIFVLIIYHFT